MFSQQISEVMEQNMLLTAPPNTTVLEAAELMENQKVGAVMVMEQEKIVGIFTERDAVFRVIARNCDVHSTLLSDVMTKSPQTIESDKTFGYALLVMYENSFRHLPVLENGKLVGMVTARSALDPDMDEFLSETERRKRILGERTK